jgi:hypothetical protein
LSEKKFYQCDVAESSTGSIWTGPVVFGTLGEAEFVTMLELQSDWGDSYMPEGFLNDFGRTEDQLERGDDPIYPGDDAWNAAGYFDEISGEGEVTTGMLTLPPIEALAQLGLIECRLNDAQIDAILKGTALASIIIKPAPRS